MTRILPRNTGTSRSRRLAAAAALIGSAIAAGCEIGKRVVIAPFYRTAELGAATESSGIAYVEGPDAHPVKHRLDLFVPADRRNWPTVVFVHGGNWTEGDRALRVRDADIYRNIGRFLAARGYGAAIISYRLIPDVSWEGQPADVARAVKWIHTNIASHGGDPNRIVLMGHSAGAQLASLVAVSPKWLAEAGVPNKAIAGVAAISGAGYDIADRETYVLLGHTKHYYAKQFGTDKSPNWEHDASPINFLDAGDPPFLLMFPTGDYAGIRRQSLIFQRALDRAKVWNWMAPISGLNHSGIILVMSRPDRAPSQVLLQYLDRLSQFPR